MTTDPRGGRADAPRGASPTPEGADVRRTRRAVAVAAGALVLAAAVVAGAVGLDGRGDPRAEPGVAPVATVTASPPSDPAPTPSRSATAAPTATPAPEPTPTPSPTSAPSAPPADAPPATPPQAADPGHGSEVWAVYVLVTQTYDGPGWAEAGARVESLGYTPSGAELACDAGAAEALGLDPQLVARGVYFDSQDDAQRFADLYGDGVVGIAPVTLMCLD